MGRKLIGIGAITKGKNAKYTLKLKGIGAKL